MPTLGDVTALLDAWYPPAHADDWDRVGLVCGDPAAPVRRILLAVDPVTAVADEAVAGEHDLVITHHPLYLRGTSTVAADTPKGRVVHRLLSHGAALFTAHTNADSPVTGVSESLALAIGLDDVMPLDPDAGEALDKLVVFAPVEAEQSLRAALAEAGAGRLGDYDACSFTSTGTGRFRPLDGATPAIGEVGSIEEVAEVRLEVVLPRGRRSAVLSALRETHPYEEPAFDLIELAAEPHPDRGSGRIGRLTQPITLRELAQRVAEALPGTAGGVRVAGEADALVETVALCGGAGDFLIDRARSAGAQAYLTSDLRHHPASEAREAGDMALLDVAHWAAEWTWLPVLAVRLREALGDTVSVDISTTPTDPWTFRVDQHAGAHR